LFTGARGVGKTSTARIFAKALNVPGFLSDFGSAVPGAESQPEVGGLHSDALDVAHAIDIGEDIDVLEIDGASNRGIEEIRQLRANVNVRPSRSNYKIYIIDEVHMLTGPAFNALLKTLEEPPPHVKFIFCTTDPDKIPITVLSRCQRFDFAPVKLQEIQARLSEIAEQEGYQVDAEALALLARRAAGSMRDSQSLLEQVMSFSEDRITVEKVHELLGTADESRLLGLAEAMIGKDALAAIELIDASIRGGTDAGQLAEQLLNYLRDVLAIGIGGGPELLKMANPAGAEQLGTLATQWGNHSLLAAIQILDECLVRMRTSVSPLTLLEVAIVQICQLEHLTSIPALLEQLAHRDVGGGGGGSRAQPTQKKKDELKTLSRESVASVAEFHSAPASRDIQRGASPSSVAMQEVASADFSEQSQGEHGTEASTVNSESEKQATAAVSFDKESVDADTRAAPQPTDIQPSSRSALQQWKTATTGHDGLLSDYASLAIDVEPLGSDRWKVVFPSGGTQPQEYCGQPEHRSELQSLLRSSLGREIQLQFAVQQGAVEKPKVAVSNSALRAQKLREMSNHPYVKRLCEVLDGEIIRVDSGRPSVPSKANANLSSGDSNSSVTDSPEA
jgi:DNA polymerase-3 subunit gamma/tau